MSTMGGQFVSDNLTNLYALMLLVMYMVYPKTGGARGSLVVKALGYKP
jgi:hypothetical protein